MNESDDNFKLRTYACAMLEERPFIRLKLDVSTPIELADFVGAFTSLSAEYERYIREAFPGEKADATLYVKNVRQGSVLADLVPWLQDGGAITTLGAANTVATFVKTYGGMLGAYLRPGGRVPDASKSQIRDFSEQVAAIANNPGSTLEVAAMEIINGEEQVRATFKFDTGQTRDIRQRLEEHKAQLDHSSRSDHTRMLMVFARSDIRVAQVGKRSGEQVIIERLSNKPRPLIYASELAERQIKHEITESEDNVFKKGFVVDINVEMQGGKPIAYSVTALHQVIDLDDE